MNKMAKFRDMNSLQPQDLHLTDWLPAGVGLDDAIAGAGRAGGAGQLSRDVAGAAAQRRVRAPPRARSSQRKETLRRQALAGASTPTAARPAVGLMREAVTRLNLLRSKHADGGPPCCSPGPGSDRATRWSAYLFARLILPSLFGIRRCSPTIMCCTCCQFRRSCGSSPRNGRGIVRLLRAQDLSEQCCGKRAKQLQLALPDGLDLMVICAEAGLSLDATLIRVSRELGDELARTRRRVRHHRRRTDLSARPPLGVRQPQQPHQFAMRSAAVVNTLAADRQVRHSAGPIFARPGRRDARRRG